MTGLGAVPAVRCMAASDRRAQIFFPGSKLYGGSNWSCRGGTNCTGAVAAPSWTAGVTCEGVTRRPGRPPLDEHDPSTTVHLRLPSTQYDNLYAIAQRAHTSVPEVIRRLIRREPHDDDGDEE